MNWFEQLFGFKEDYHTVKDNFILSKYRIKSKVNDKVYKIGKFDVVSLKNLRKKLKYNEDSLLTFSEVYGDVTDFMSDSGTFMVASQFNCLEFKSSFVTPEKGITNYIHDMTQGPACSIATGPATLYRNYFVELNGRIGQTSDNQINIVSFLDKVFNGTGWKVENGYSILSDETLHKINNILKSSDKDKIKENLCAGIHRSVQVTSKFWGTKFLDKENLIDLVLCSACSVSYSGNNTKLWEPLARLILETMYEICFIRAINNKKSNKLYLTYLGGGAFGNDISWIKDAVSFCCKKYKNYNIQVYMINYRRY
jgi:hypothetical protein